MSDQELLSKVEEPKRRTNHVCSRKLLSVACVVITLVALILAATLLALYLRRQCYDKVLPEAIVVKTECGKIEGKKVKEGIGNVYAFKGIPYAKQPIRWKPSQSLLKSGHCWSGILKADKFGNVCAQPDLETYTKFKGSEDCLFLNVWTPRVSISARLPIMVWIHGGDLAGESGNVLGAADVVNSMDIVLVSLNYRLNAFGFMTLEALSQNSTTKTSGNYGFMDQILALKWVKRNIARFGGNPDMITVVGHSSGATSVYGLLASKKANGLFKRAIAMSGSPVFKKTTREASKDNEIFLKNSKCNKSTTEETLKCLYGLTQTQILKSVPWFTYPSWAMLSLCDLVTKGKFEGALCVVDGDVVFAPPGKLNTLPPLPHNVSLLIGSTAQEIDFIPLKDFRFKPWSEFVKFVGKRLGAFSNTLAHESLQLYNETLNSKSAQLFYTTMASDIRVTCPENILAANLSITRNLDVYRYIVTNKPSSPAQYYKANYTSLYSAHMWDSGALFGFHGIPINYKPSPRDLRFVKEIRKEFLHFMKTGKPAHAHWHNYPKNIGIFENEGLAVKADYHKKHCKLWNSYNLFPYGWVN